MIQQDTTVSNIKVVLGETTKDAIAKNLGDLNIVTLLNVSGLKDCEIDNWNCSNNTKTRLKGFRDYTKLFLEDTDSLSHIRRELLCPITLSLPKTPILSPCCGQIFDKSALFHHLKESENATMIGGKCPLCRSYIRTSLLLELVGNTSLRNMIAYCAL